MRWWNIFRRKKTIETEEVSSQSDTKDQSYEEVLQHIKQTMSHGHLNMGAFSEHVDVEAWLPEFNSCNVTIFCDRLLIKDGKVKEGIIAITDEVFKYISILNIEQQSSGFKIIDKIEKEGKPDVLLLKVCPEDVKDNLIIPNQEYVWGGFVWGKDFRGDQFDQNKGSSSHEKEKTHLVPTSKYGHRFILNFSVSGEFNLSIFFIPKGGGKPVWLFEKSFCCK